MDKRSFIKNISLLGLVTVPGTNELDSWLSKFEDKSPKEMADDETFWEGIRKGYRIKSDYINLDNAYYCFLP